MPGRSTITAAELAERIGGAVTGDAGLVIHGVGTLESAGPGELSWIAGPDLVDRAARSKAGVLLAPTNCALPADRTVIRVADPDLAMCLVLPLLAPPPDRVEPGVHDTAVVHPSAVVEGAAVGANTFVGAGAVVGEGTQLFPGAYVGSDSKIGRDCVLWPNVVVRERITIGDRVVIHPNATIGADGFGYLQRDNRHVKIPQVGTVVIEDDVEVGASTAIDRAKSGVTRIGRGTKIDNFVQIAHNVDVGEHCLIIAQTGIAGSATLGRHVVLSGQVGVVDHRHLGDGVKVAAKSAVMNSFPAGQTVRGIPAIQNQLYLRQEVAVRKLPALLKELRKLRRRVTDLERSASGENVK